MTNRPSAEIRRFWQRFLADTHRVPDLAYNDCFYFDLTEESAASLLALVLQGQKRATASSIFHFQARNEPLPQVGDLCIVTDFQNRPHCVIETTAVTILPFREMTFEICQREGEDENLESWQRNHVHFFTTEGAELGYRFDEDMPVVFEDFRVIYPSD